MSGQGPVRGRTPRCAECDRPQRGGLFHPANICGQARCRAAMVARVEAARGSARVNLRTRALALLRKRWHLRIARIAADASCAPAEVAVEHVPGIPAGPLVALPLKRRDAFQSHLTRVVSAAFAHPTDPQSQPETEAGSAMVATACAACRGACCRLGAQSQAFLTPEVIAATRLHRPDLAPSQMVAHYLDALPEKSVPGSCVFHGKRGCTLHRDDRSRLCNRYLCEDMQAAGATHRPDRPTLIVARPEKGRARGAVVPPAR